MKLPRGRSQTCKGLLIEFSQPKMSYFKIKELYHKYANEKSNVNLKGLFN